MGSIVKIPCRFLHQYQPRVKEWFRVQSSGGEALSKDPQFSGRVSVRTKGDDCELTVRNASVSDSGIYNFRVEIVSGDWIEAKSGVHLTVTDLQVKVDVNPLELTEVKVTCISMCALPTSRFHWYRNDVFIQNGSSMVLHSDRPSYDGNYSCQAGGSPHRSPPACVQGRGCWSVTYTPDRVCALIGASIDLSCSYKHPAVNTVTKSEWLIKHKADGEGVDVMGDGKYRGRVRYTHNSQNNSSLRISNLRETDARVYTFRFYTNGGDYTGDHGVSLSVTGLKVTVSDSGDGQMTLSCNTTCALSSNPTYIWYKNGERVSECKSASCSVAAVSGDVAYSCAVEGHDGLQSPPLYTAETMRLQKVAVGLIVFLAVTVILSAVLCMGAKKLSSGFVHGSPPESQHRQSAPDLSGSAAEDSEDSVNYSSVVFKPFQLEEGSLPPESPDEDHVEYATVKKNPRFKKTFRMSRR